jgi:ATP-dependent Clp protease protease subunit
MMKAEEVCEDNKEKEILEDVMFFPELSGELPGMRTISVYGEINEDQGRMITTALSILRESGRTEESEKDKDDPTISYSPIDFIISTEGGNVQDMFAIYDCIRDVRKDCEIKTFGVGKVMSAGILLLAGGTPGERRVGKHCRLMMHSVQGAHFGSIKELETDIREVRWYQEQLTKALVEETKLSYKELKSMFRKKTDTYFDAEQAVAWGIADEIV